MRTGSGTKLGESFYNQAIAALERMSTFGEGGYDYLPTVVSVHVVRENGLHPKVRRVSVWRMFNGVLIGGHGEELHPDWIPVMDWIRLIDENEREYKKRGKK